MDNLCDIEHEYEVQAIEALKRHSEAIRTNNNYYLCEAAGVHDDILEDPKCPSSWRALLTMSKATLDPSNWQKHVSSALHDWELSKQPNSGRMWQMLTDWLSEVANMVSGRDDHLTMYPMGPDILPVLPERQAIFSETSSIEPSALSEPLVSPSITQSSSSSSTSISGGSSNRGSRAGSSTRKSSVDHTVELVTQECEFLKEAFAQLDVPLKKRPDLTPQTILEDRQTRKETSLQRGFVVDQFNQPMRMVHEVDENTSPTYVKEIAGSPSDPSADDLLSSWNSLIEVNDAEQRTDKATEQTRQQFLEENGGRFALYERDWNFDKYGQE